MYADNSLMPKEALRLAALGILAGGPKRYDALAAEMRHFVSRLTGPSLDLMGSSVELLRYEGLIEAAGGDGTPEAPLRLTAKGREELRTLLAANIRAPATDFTRLVLALKLRFLHLLEPAEQAAQAELFVEVTEKELARLLDLRQHHAADPGHLAAWLDHEIGAVEARLAWFEGLRERLAAGGCA